uniref:Ubiquitin-like protease family profile domain-containing protein n=1 Tax=Brassica oleracea var. oleracea TaxID=109376 RepID=A0A0D3E9V8_BRAOL
MSESNLQNEDARYLEKRDAALALCRAKSDRTRKLAASQKSPYTANSTARVIISNRKIYPGYNPFAPIDKTKLKELAYWFKSCPHYRTALDKKPRKSRTWWYQILRTSLEWLEDCHVDAFINVLRKRYDANPQHLRSERMCFLDHLFAQQWRFNFKDFMDSKPDHNGTIPSFFQSNKVWGMDIDDIYAPVNFADSHWIAMWISIPKRHIAVFDSICSSISPEELDVVMEPFLYMVPYLLVECASSDELRAQYSLEPFTYERPTNIPPAQR